MPSPSTPACPSKATCRISLCPENMARLQSGWLLPFLFLQRFPTSYQGDSMSMKRLATLLAACAIASPALAADNIAVVNGQPVSAEQVDELVRMMVQQGAPDSPELRTQVREELINRAVMVQAAEAAGIAEKPSVQNELDLARQSVLIRGLFADYLEKNPITEEATIG